MMHMIQKSRIFVCSLIITAFVFVSLPAAGAEKEPSGTVSIKFTSVAIGIGFQWGKGVLHFSGVDFPFKVSGLSVADVGYTSIEATGKVYNLSRAADFAGGFTAAGAGVSVGEGFGIASLENQNGVVLILKSKKSGVQFTLGLGGVRVQMLPVGDSDGDGIADDKDQCPDTLIGVDVDENGCPFDYDGDGVPYYLDECPDTPKGVKVDEKGCPLDGDGDGVPDFLEKCPDTPKGVKVDEKGCPLDGDGDGVPDYLEKCPDTPEGVKVDEKGCPLDGDGDGVPDYLDKCPDTPKGMSVDITGCWIAKGLEFDYNKWEIKSKYYGLLNKAVRVFNMNPTLTAEIVGHTDNVGSDKFNQELSEKRANAVRDYFIANGISLDRLTARGMGEKDPIASNETPDGRAQNRRIEFIPSRR